MFALTLHQKIDDENFDISSNVNASNLGKIQVTFKRARYKCTNNSFSSGTTWSHGTYHCKLKSSLGMVTA